MLFLKILFWLFAFVFEVLFATILLVIFLPFSIIYIGIVDAAICTNKEADM